MSASTDQLCDLRVELEPCDSYKQAMTLLTDKMMEIPKVSHYSSYYIYMNYLHSQYYGATAHFISFDKVHESLLRQLNRKIVEEKEMDEDKSFHRTS